MSDWLEQNQADGRWSVESGVQRRLQGVLTEPELEHSRNAFIPSVPVHPGLSSPFYLALKGNVILSLSKQVGPSVSRHPLNGHSLSSFLDSPFAPQTTI